MMDVKVEVVENRVAEREYAKLAPPEPHAGNRHSLRISDTERPLRRPASLTVKPQYCPQLE